MAKTRGPRAVAVTAASTRPVRKAKTNPEFAKARAKPKTGSREKPSRKDFQKVTKIPEADEKNIRGQATIVVADKKATPKAKGRPAKGSKNKIPKLLKDAPEPEMVMNDELKTEALEYEVEEVVNYRLGDKGNREYEVKWVGWDKIHNTWEPEVNLHNAFEKITEFDDRNLNAA